MSAALREGPVDQDSVVRTLFSEHKQNIGEKRTPERRYASRVGDPQNVVRWITESLPKAQIPAFNYFAWKTTDKGGMRMASTGSSLAPTPPPKGATPDTLEARAAFRMHCAGLSEPGQPQTVDPRLVLVTAPDGGLVVYPPSRKLAILAEERAKRAPAAAPAKN